MKLRRFASALRNDTSGVALTEFAVAFPIMLALGMYGVDTANFALTHLRLNQIALNLADNASRVGISSSTLSETQMREVDVADVFQAAKTQGASIDLEANSRVILSSLEKDSGGTQRIHWQRCFGSKTDDAYSSHFGKVKNTDGNEETDSNGNGTIETSELRNEGQAAPNGIGDSMQAAVDRVNAPSNSSGVMFVEINYRYIPMFSWLSAPADLRYVASFIVRDKRNFSQIYPTAGTTPSYCDYANRAAPPPVPS